MKMANADGQPRADGGWFAGSGPAGDDGRRTVGLVAEHAGEIDGKLLPDLLGDGGEQFVRRRRTGCERRDPT